MTIFTTMAPSLPSLALVAALSLLPSASADLRSRLASAGIDALFPGDSGFTTAATPFNKRLTFQPAAIAYPDDAEGVSKVVLAGAAENVSGSLVPSPPTNEWRTDFRAQSTPEVEGTVTRPTVSAGRPAT